MRAGGYWCFRLESTFRIVIIIDPRPSGFICRILKCFAPRNFLAVDVIRIFSRLGDITIYAEMRPRFLDFSRSFFPIKLHPKNSYHFSDWPFVFGRSATSCLRISRERKRACARALSIGMVQPSLEREYCSIWIFFIFL